MTMSLTVIIPAHNEARDLADLVGRFVERLPATASKVLTEIVIVENGSTDGTLEAAQDLERRHAGLVRATSVRQASYGAAIKSGMEQSRGTHLSILECDALDAAFVAESVGLLEGGRAEFVIASKRHPDSIDRRPWARRAMTAGFNALLRSATGYPGSDTHGLKSIEGSLARRLCGLSMTGGEVFQTEIVLLAWRLGHPVVEVPIDIGEVRASPVGILRRVTRVAPVLSQLRRSLQRFPAGPGVEHLVTVLRRNAA